MQKPKNAFSVVVCQIFNKNQHQANIFKSRELKLKMCRCIDVV